MRNSLLWAVALLSWCACRDGQQPTAASSSASASPEVPADFITFYQQFHADSVFQVQHISWPLAGQTTQAAPDGTLSAQPTYWERDEWRFQRPVDFSTGEFKQQLLALEDQYVVEIISYAQASHFALERRFMRRSDGAWELVYYADMQER